MLGVNFSLIWAVMLSAMSDLFAIWVWILKFGFLSEEEDMARTSIGDSLEICGSDTM